MGFTRSTAYESLAIGQSKGYRCDCKMVWDDCESHRNRGTDWSDV